MSRTILSTVSMFALVFFAGCAMHETYGDRALPEAERAIIEGYWRYQVLYLEELQIVSVDGRREAGQNGYPYASSVSVGSGRHWLQLLILRESILRLDSRDITMCAFEWTFESKHHYKLHRVNREQFALEHPPSPRFPASISVVVTAPSKPAQHLSARAECGNAANCRQTSDCPSQHDCQMDPGFEFGTCKSHDR